MNALASIHATTDPDHGTVISILRKPSMRDFTRRLAALETRREDTVPRYVVLWNDDRLIGDVSEGAQVIQVSWIDPSGTAILALPHNNRDPLPRGDV